MAINTSTNKKVYEGNGVTTVFSFDFLVLDSSHLEVTKYDSAGNDTTLIENVDYTVSGIGSESGGDVTLSEPLPSGERLLLYRDVPYTQENSYIEGESFPIKTVERALDKLTMETQQLYERTARSLKFSKVDTFADVEIGALVAGKALVVNDDGNKLIMGPDADDLAFAEQYAENAENSATEAANSATEAANSATEAANSATEAANSATEAANSAGVAERAGYGYIAIDVSAGGDISIASTDAEHNFIRLYGTPSANYSILINQDNKIHFIQNETGFVCTVKKDGATGNTVNIYPKQVAVISIVGSDVVSLADTIPAIVKDVSDIGDWDQVVDSGMVRGTNMANKPDHSGYWQFGLVFKHVVDGYVLQVVSDFGPATSGDGAVWYRHLSGGSWSEWKRLAMESGRVVYGYTQTDVDYTATEDDCIIGVTDTSAARTITIPTSLLTPGKVIIVKDESGGAATNNITIATEGTETIDGAATAVISTDYGSVKLYSNGTVWFII